MCVLILLTDLSEIFLVTRIYRNFMLDVRASLFKASVNLSYLKNNFNFLDRFWTDFQISNFMKILTVEAEIFHAVRRMD